MRRFSLIILLFVLLNLGSCGPGQEELRLVSPFAPVDRAIADDLSGLLDASYSTRLIVTGSSLSGEAALDAVASGAADIALVSNSLPFRNDIATVMPLYPTVLHIAYRKGRDASTGSALLRGAKIYAGPEGSASRTIFARIVDRLQLDVSAYDYVTDLTDHPDVVIVFAPISPELFLDYPDFRLFSIGSAVDAAVLLNPHFRPFVIPAGTYGETTAEAIVTIAVDKLLVTRNDLDSSVVYDLINDILRLRPALAAKRPGLFQQLSEDFDTSRSRFMLHAGTQAYLQRSAPTVYERYSGIAEVTVTLIVALGSALYAGIRIFKMRRKNRIDTFYTQTITLQRSVTDSTGSEELARVIKEVRSLQTTAFDLLVDEKLAADESFRIFITLSNDVMRQLGDTAAQRRKSDA
ncbi:MAG: hypothetical protein IH913_10125 [Proteobacteria bacterium]|nr:hypothetical protein [Pseudomonadota bacterium]